MPAAANLLGRAAALLPERDPERLRLAVTHGVALAEAGEQQRALEVPAGVVAAATAAGDELARWHATLEHAALEWAMHPERWAPEDMLRLAEQARAVFERHRNDAGLAKAWRLVCDVHALRCRLADAGAAAERALEHARRAGDLREQAESMFAEATALRYGPTHATTGIRRCARLLREGLDDARAATAVLATLAFLEGRRGWFAQARRVLAAAHDRAEDLGVRWLVAMVSWQAGRTETLAGDLAAAKRHLRAVDATLAEIGAEGHRVTVACDLARVLTEQGRDREAMQLVERTREAAAPDDLITQLKWRAVGARTLARLGYTDRAEGLAHQAVRLAEQTDALETHGEALLDLAEVLRRAGRPGDAAQAAQEAARLFQHKGNRPAAKQAAATLRSRRRGIRSP